MNRFKEVHELEEKQEEITSRLEEKESKPEIAEKSSASGFFKTFFIEGVVSKEAATEMLPYLMFLGFLAMIYIANSHMAISNIRRIDKLSKEVKELTWDYKSLKADLMYKSKLTEVAKIVDTLGIKELVEPPKKLIISNEY